MHIFSAAHSSGAAADATSRAQPAPAHNLLIPPPSSPSPPSTSLLPSPPLRGRGFKSAAFERKKASKRLKKLQFF